MCWAAAVRERVRHVIDRGCGDRVSLVAKKLQSWHQQLRRLQLAALFHGATDVSVVARDGPFEVCRVREATARAGGTPAQASPGSAAGGQRTRLAGRSAVFRVGFQGGAPAVQGRLRRGVLWQCSVKERHPILSRIVRHVLQLHIPGFTTAKFDPPSRSNDADSTSTTTATTGHAFSAGHLDQHIWSAGAKAPNKYFASMGALVFAATAMVPR